MTKASYIGQRQLASPHTPWLGPQEAWSMFQTMIGFIFLGMWSSWGIHYIGDLYG
ncbi:hypothetical protein L209DRAFT_760370 [Thermothelomyces heterothallicus CBS 203.75]